MFFLLFILFIVSCFFMFFLVSKNVLSLLLILEYFILLTYLILCTFVFLTSRNIIIGFYYLTVVVCDRGLGLRVLVLLVRSHGKDFLFFNI